MSRWLGLALLGVTGALLVVLAIDLGLPAGPTLETLALLAAVVVGLGAATRLPHHAPRRARRSHVPEDGDDEVERVERVLAAVARTARGRDQLLGPLLRPLVEHRCERHGVDLRDGPAAAALLGEELHSLVVPDRTRVPGEDGAGLDGATLRRLITRLEEL